MPNKMNRNFPVNWVDGMKVSSDDFLKLEYSINERIRDQALLFSANGRYGLLPCTHQEVDNYPKFELKYNQDSILITLRECRAITPGGYRVEITERNFEEHQAPAVLPAQEISNSKDGKYHVYIAVFGNQLVGAGPYASEGPPRPMYLTPRYQLYIFPDEENAQVGLSGNQFKIGELKISNTVGELDKQFLPMCFSMSSHNQLRRIHQQFYEKLFEKTFKSVQKTLLNIKQSAIPSTYAEDVLDISEKLVQFLAGRSGHYQYVLSQAPPVEFISFFTDLAGHLVASFECLAHGKDIVDEYPDKCRQEYGDVTIFEEAARLLAQAVKENSMGTAQYGLGARGLTPKMREIELFLNKLDNYFEEMQYYRFGQDRRKGGGVFGRTR
jgi:hypothetical protein